MNPEDRGEVRRKRIGLAAGVAVFLAIALIPSGLHEIEEAGRRPAWAAATAALMAVWWFTEALPIHWTACVPLALYPLLGVFGEWWGREGAGAIFRENAARTVSPFLDAYLFLFLGGMMIGVASQQWNLHRRVALHIMRAIGTEPRRLLLGVVAASAFISMWISNTATAVMMMPIGMALLAQLEAARGGGRMGVFGTAVMLGIAYGCNVGGIGTKIGTGPNSIFAGWVSRNLEVDGRPMEITFLGYLAVGLPFVLLFVPVVWAVLWRLGRREAGTGDLQGRGVLEAELARLGPMSRQEKKVLAVFLAAAAFWILGGLIRPLVAPHVPAFWEGFRFREKHYEAGVAMAAGLSLFALRALSWRSFLRIPWETLVLLGGGFAMAEGIEGSRLADWMRAQLGGMERLGPFWQVGLASLAGVGLSAVASNTATVSVMLNILPRHLPVLASVTLASSCDFMLPAGTPPNAIVFGSGYIRLPVMIRTGFALNLLAVVALTFYGHLYLSRLFA